MEQKDYLLREIEKMGSILRAIFSKLKELKVNDAIKIRDQINQTKDLILSQTNFDLEKFVLMNETESKVYLTTFEGLSSYNMELLANVLYELGIVDNDKSLHYYTKALLLLNLCKTADKSYSVDREYLIIKIRNHLNK